MQFSSWLPDQLAILSAQYGGGMDEQKILAERRILKNWEIIAVLIMLTFVIIGGVIYSVINFFTQFISAGLSKRH